MKAALVAKFGEEANFLVVEAIVEAGVVLSPLGKYRDFNIRVCRPFNLSAADLADVMDEAIRSVGDTYDLRNVIDLARYFLPVSLVPARFRRQALQFGSGVPTRVICSSVIASSFHRVKFPIVPNYEHIASEAASSGPAAPAQAVADRLENYRCIAIRRAQDGLADSGDAARFRLVTLFRDNQIQYYREHAFRLSQDFVGRRRAARAGEEGRMRAEHRASGELPLSNENEKEHAAGRRELLEKTIAKILHRHCNFGWANYYIPSEKFPSLIEELVEVMSPGGQAGHDELVQFFLSVQRLPSIQERVAKLEQEFSVYKRG